MKKTVKAPKYFVDAKKDSKSYVDEMEKELKSSEVVVIKMRTKENPLKFVEGKLQKMRYLKEFCEKILDAAWARFRLDNWNNEFGQAKSLVYDSKREIIIIKKK